MLPKNLLFILFFAVSHLPFTATKTLNITAVFAFGDSILDAGNNNRLKTIARCNFVPYGKTFPGGAATGRFTDGKLATDIIVSELNIKPVLPAYLDPTITNKDLLTGASFASGAAGLDDLTSKGANALSLEKQVGYFREAVGRMRRIASRAKVDQVIGNAIFFVAVGNNDWLINYYPLPILRQVYSVEQYQDMLLKKMESFIKNLQKAGARKIAVLGLPPLGCLPLQMTLDNIKHVRSPSKRVCVNEQNSDSQAYNVKLKALLARLSHDGNKLAYIDTYTLVMDILTKPTDYGFEKSTEGCCGTGKIEIGPLCNKFSKGCLDPSKYVFWDAVHPSEASYTIFAKDIIDNVLPKLVE